MNKPFLKYLGKHPGLKACDCMLGRDSYSKDPAFKGRVSSLPLSIAARSSPLSRAQVHELAIEVQIRFPEIHFAVTWVTTTGDRDQKTSIRNLDKTDFFTKEIDQLLLSGICRLGVHSAKDLPEPLPEGLSIVAVTKGVDPSDSLVLRSGETLETLPSKAVIATSSERREWAVKALRADFSFVDLRGTIGDRLKKLETKEVDAVVVAEAALIRLNLTHLNRIKLPGETAPAQGRLAVVARENDREMARLFSFFDQRPTVLYLGLDPHKGDVMRKILPYPIIRIIPRPFLQPDLSLFTHLLFTSKTAVSLFFEQMKGSRSMLKSKTFLAVGRKTAKKIENYGLKADWIPQNESAEGIIAELEKHDLRNSRFFWPHSSLARPLISLWFQKQGIPLEELILYDTFSFQPGPIPNPADYDEILFTSPSTVEGFLKVFGKFPPDKKLTAIGQVTEKLIPKCLLITPFTHRSCHLD